MTDPCGRCGTWCYGDCGHDDSPRQASAVTVTQRGADLVVSSPYNSYYVAGVKALGGRWSPESKAWSVPLAQRDQLRALLLRVYRTDAGLPAPAAGPRPPRTPREVVAAALRELQHLETYINPNPTSI